MTHKQTTQRNIIALFGPISAILIVVLVTTTGAFSQSPSPAASTTNATSPKATPTPAKVQSDPIVDKWRMFDSFRIFRPDGTATGPGGAVAGKWRCLSSGSPRHYEINWNGGVFIDTVRLVKNGTELSGKNQRGNKVLLTRIPKNQQ